MAFIERIPTEKLDPQESVDIAHFNLGTEFYRSILLSPDNRTYPRLAEADDAIIDPGTARFVHLTLLGIQRADNGQSFSLPPGQGLLPFVGVVLNHTVNVLQIAPQEVKLLSLGIPNAPAGLLAALGKSVVLLLGYDAVCSGFLAACESRCVKCVYDSFCVLSRFIQ